MVPAGLCGVTIPPDWLWMKGSTEQPQYSYRACTASDTPPDGVIHLGDVGCEVSVRLLHHV